MNKRTLLLTFCLISIVAITNAQRLTFGALAGINFSSVINASPIYGKQTRTGLLLGGYATRMLKRKMSLQAELLYSSMGFKNNAYAITTTMRFDYVSLPVLFRYHVIEHCYVFAGPQINTLLFARQSDESSQSTVTKSYKSFDYGGLVGVGYQYGRWSIAARYYMGLSDINALRGFGPTSNKLQNESFQITAGFRIRNSKKAY